MQLTKYMGLVKRTVIDRISFVEVNMLKGNEVSKLSHVKSEDGPPL
jgi:hypothetical protein